MTMLLILIGFISLIALLHVRRVVLPVAAGVLLFGGVGVASMALGGNFLDYDVLAHDAQHGQHRGIFLVELGIGITVAAVMATLFFLFTLSFFRGNSLRFLSLALASTTNLGFLGLNTWVDLRPDSTDAAALDLLAGAIRGEPPDAAEAVADARAAVCPYRGLEPFREEDAAFFFGRDDFTDRLVHKVAQRDLIAESPR